MYKDKSYKNLLQYLWPAYRDKENKRKDVLSCGPVIVEVTHRGDLLNRNANDCDLFPDACA
jgi:hypothetical protein